MEVDDDGPLDFENEETSPKKNTHSQRSQNVIGLDDLLRDYYQEKITILEKDSKKTKVYSSESSDDENDWPGNKKVKELAKFVSECEKQVSNICSSAEITDWGLKVFDQQILQNHPSVAGVEKLPFVQDIIKDSMLRSIIGLPIDDGGTFMLELLTSKWLLNIVLSRGCCEPSVFQWAFNLMLYSSNDNVEISACNFLCNIICSGNKKSDVFTYCQDSEPSCTIEWIPPYAELKKSIENYGYLEAPEASDQIDSDESSGNGPPRNVRSWMKFVVACCENRKRRSLFTADEIENLVVIMTHFFLDHQLLYLNILLRESLISVIESFTEEEWYVSLKKISSRICCSLPKMDFNCLRLVDSLSSGHIRMKELKWMVSRQLLLTCMGKQESTDDIDIVRDLSFINIRKKQIDFSQLFIWLSLADSWLWCNTLIRQGSSILETWLQFLRNCSCQISSTDWRTYASKLRNKASYFLQIYGGQK